QGIACFDPQQHRSLAFLYGQDSEVGCRSHAARSLWFLGYPDQARQRDHEALLLAQQLSHPYTLATALAFSAWLHQLCQDEQATQERAEAAVTLSTEQGFIFWMTWGTILRGWALTKRGQGGDGIVQIRKGLGAFRATGAEVAARYFLALLAEA